MIAQTARTLPQSLSPDIQISLSFSPGLTAYRGKLLSQVHGKGTAVYAAAFVREQRIVLERALLSRPRELQLTLLHEMSHFVWVHLGNPKRSEFEAILRREIMGRAKSEIGESAEVQKIRLLSGGYNRPESSRWRDYICESFCDTAAWFYSGINNHPTFKLAERWRVFRRRWFQALN